LLIWVLFGCREIVGKEQKWRLNFKGKWNVVICIKMSFYGENVRLCMEFDRMCITSMLCDWLLAFWCIYLSLWKNIEMFFFSFFG
jgi:hypothetical protein